MDSSIAIFRLKRLLLVRANVIIPMEIPRVLVVLIGRQFLLRYFGETKFWGRGNINDSYFGPITIPKNYFKRTYMCVNIMPSDASL